MVAVVGHRDAAADACGACTPPPEADGRRSGDGPALTLAVLLILHRRGQAGHRPRRARCRRGGARRPTNTNVFLIVDRSRGLGRRRLRRRTATNVGNPQRHRALIDQYPGARFAMIAFASRPSLDWPLVGGCLEPASGGRAADAVSRECRRRRRERGGRRQRPALSAHRGRPAVPRLARAWCSTSVRARPVPARRRASSTRPPDRSTAGRCSDTAPRETNQACAGSPNNSACPTCDRDDGRPVAESAPGRGAAAQPSARRCRRCRRPHGAVLGLHDAGRGAAAVRALREHPRHPPHSPGQTGCGAMTVKTVAADPAQAAACCSPHRWR